MGVMLSVLVAGVGAMDLIYCLAYVSGSEQPSNAIEDVPDKQQHEQQQQQQQQPDAKVEQLEQYKETVRQQIKAAPPRSTVEGVTYAQDGVPYKDGYRLEPSVEGAAQLDVLIEKLRILERQSQEKEQQLEQMSVQMSELERSTAEQSLIIEELRSRSTSRAHSVEPLGAYRNNLSPADAVPQIVLNEPHDSGGGADEPRPSSSKFRPIRRDDGLRRSVKRRSVTSVTSLEDRTDELERLSQLEDEECARMDDYIPIVYSRDEQQDPMNRRHNISPIPESCHHHEDDERQWVPERSPEPTLAANTTRPWGDIKLDEMKEKAVLRPSRSMSIEEEELEPPAVAAAAQQLHVSESAPSNLSSHSNSPDREERRGSGRVEPMLRRTTKEADLTSLLQEQQKEQQQQGGGGASQSQASNSSRPPWTTEIIVPEDDAVVDDYDSDGGGSTATATRRRPIPQFMQSKSPSPYADGASVHGHERPPLADISNRLVPLVPPPYPSRPRSPTPYDEPAGSSRESTPSSGSSSSSSTSSSSFHRASLEKISNGFVSRARSISPRRAAGREGRRSVSSSRSPSPTRAVSTGRRGHDASPDDDVPPADPVRRRPGDLRLGSSNAPSARAVTPADGNDVGGGAGRLLSPLAAALVDADAGAEGDTEGENGEQQLLSVAPRRRGSGRSKASASPGSSLAPPARRYKERKRVARSLTPIDYDQTFMDSFTEQHLSVTPSELEDYINSMDAISFEPPPLVKPAYLYPAALPSLVLTDEQGTDAQFHDEMSAKSFYGQSHAHEGVTLNHRVSYCEWIKKFPDNQTSHLALEDFDSDDEEVEQICRQAVEVEALFPSALPQSAGSTPQPSKPLTPATATASAQPGNERNEFPVHRTPAYATPSPVSLVSDLSDLSSPSSQPPSPSLSLATQPSPTVSSSLALGSPLLNSYHNHNAPEHHFTPIPSDSHDTHDSSSPLSSSLHSPQSPAAPPSPQHHTTTAPLRPSLTVPVVPSRTPSVSPLPLDASPEELVFEIGHLDGLIFEAKSREPTPSRAPSRSEPLLRPDELAFDIGNMGGLILGPPSRSVSPAPPIPHPSIESSGGGGASLSPLSWESAAGSAAAHNEHTK
uniref:Uncharacterized protein n=1 Tax=Anopheles melas TaxID=34690 RepID=A0A182TPC1_9DIPT